MAVSLETAVGQLEKQTEAPQLGKPYSQLNSDSARQRDESFHNPAEL